VAWSTSGLTGENHGQAGETGDGFVPAGRGKHGTADNTSGRARDDNAQTADAVPPPEATHRYYWTEVPRFKSMWGAHESAWPKESQPAAKIDRSGDPPGSWRSDSNLLLSPDKHDRTKEAISEVHGVESHVTEDLRQIKDESPYSAELVGLEFRRKGEDRLKEKVAEFIRDNPDAPPREVVQGIPDAIRYTFSTQKDDYTTAYRDLKERLEAHGYEMYYSNNSWDQAEYKGINTRWITPEGQRFELQFHTLESHHAKQEVTHQAYERIRNPLTSKAELQALKSFQREVSSWIPVPQGVTEISSFRKKGY
jgi:virulence-associated protein VapD